MTTPSNKPEYPPLLPVGLHPKTVEEIRDMCVKAFPLSKTRDKIMSGLESVVRALRRAGVAVEVWVDGSFLTQKIDPKDVDFVLCVKNDVYEQGTPEQKRVLEWVALADLKTVAHCDSYIFFEYPTGHALHGQGVSMRDYWMKHFGSSRGGDDKGIALLRVS